MEFAWNILTHEKLTVHKKTLIDNAIKKMIILQKWGYGTWSVGTL